MMNHGDWRVEEWPGFDLVSWDITPLREVCSGKDVRTPAFNTDMFVCICLTPLHTQKE